MFIVIKYFVIFFFVISTVTLLCICMYFGKCVDIKDKINDLKIVNCEYKCCSNKYRHTSCSICMEEFISTSPVSIIEECQHLFHRACLIQWLVNHKENILFRCPYCRRAIIKNND